MNKVLGVILAGGLSRRMGGEEKSLMKLGGNTPIEMVKTRLARQVEQIILNANGDASRFEFLNLPVVRDTVDGFVGPLAGILTGMRWVEENSDHTHVITAAADTPFFPDNYVDKMLNMEAEIVLAASNGRRHPVFGLWPITLADALEHFLVEEENRKVMLFVQRYKNAIVDFPNSTNDEDPFFNVNTPDDMSVAEKIAARTP